MFSTTELIAVLSLLVSIASLIVTLVSRAKMRAEINRIDRDLSKIFDHQRNDLDVSGALNARLNEIMKHRSGMRI